MLLHCRHIALMLDAPLLMRSPNQHQLQFKYMRHHMVIPIPTLLQDHVPLPHHTKVRHYHHHRWYSTGD